MEFLHASIALLASMVLVLAGMVGWLYWQQTRLFQNMNNIVMVIGELARSPEPAPIALPDPPAPTEDDDRVSVTEETTGEVDIVEGPMDLEDFDGKTKKDLQDILTKKGIPFSKSDNKNALISLLKATS